MKRKKLIVILGPTATGKTKLAAKLAAKFNGEIISADSRQVYRGMDIGTGKDLADYVLKVKSVKIPHHLIDVVSPKTEFNVAKYQKLAYQSIDDVLARKKTPFLVGGTGLYIDSIIKGYVFAKKDTRHKIQDTNLRKSLNKLTLARLLSRLKKIDLATYKIIDKKNRRRVQRALEIFYETGRTKSSQPKASSPDYDVLVLGVKFPLQKIYEKIDSRLENRLKEGMVKEVKKLRKQGVSWKRLDDFGLEYRYVARYLQGKIKYEELVAELKKAIHHFAKRQTTWFKRNSEIIWLEDFKKAEKEIKRFLKK